MIYDPQQAVGRKIRSVKDWRDDEALYHDFALEGGGTLRLRFQRDVWGWEIMVSERPAKVWLRWIDPQRGYHYPNDPSYHNTFEGRTIKGITADGTFQFLLDDGEWSPSIEIKGGWGSEDIGAYRVLATYHA